jgi:magnesium and cobalt transporter
MKPEPEGQQLVLPNLPPPAKGWFAGKRPPRIAVYMRWLRSRFGSKNDGSLKEIIEEALEENPTKEFSIREEEKDLLKNVVRFSELTAREVMVPRTEILALPRNVSLDALRQHVVEIGHTRIPVFDESLDKIDGFIHIKDLVPYLNGAGRFEIGALLHEILFVPPSMRIVDLLLKMRVSGCHMAIVVDEYGGTSGLVTMEDLFEELVGEIQDEHDDEHSAPHLRWLGEVLEADARVSIKEIESALRETLHGEGVTSADYDSLGGFIFFTLGRVPVKGEVIKVRERLKIEITSADPRRVRQVRITRLAPSHAPVPVEPAA